MKCCPNCKGALDSNGKCMACGTVTELKLSAEDGQVLNKIPKDLAYILKSDDVKIEYTTEENKSDADEVIARFPTYRSFGFGSIDGIDYTYYCHGYENKTEE